MDLEWHPEAVKEFLNLDNELQKPVNTRIKKLPNKGVKWNQVERVKRGRIGLDIYRLKIDPEDTEELNHRILFDIKSESFLILKIGRRPEFYSLENLEEAVNRLR